MIRGISQVPPAAHLDGHSPWQERKYQIRGLFAEAKRNRLQAGLEGQARVPHESGTVVGYLLVDHLNKSDLLLLSSCFFMARVPRCACPSSASKVGELHHF